MLNKNIFSLIFSFICILILFSILKFGWTQTWAVILGPTITLKPYFADMRTVQGALLSIQQEFNPQLVNPGDPWGRPMNYPSVWVVISDFFALNFEKNYLIFIISSVTTYLSACLYLLRKYPSIWLLLAIFSGSSLLAIERGNNDLMVFILLFFSASKNLLLKSLLIIFAGVLKIYPFFSAITLSNNKKYFIAVTSLAGIYLVYVWPEIENIRRNTPISAIMSYGVPSISEAIKLKLNVNLNSWLVAIFMIAFAVLFGNSNKVKNNTTIKTRKENEFILFQIGASIFLSTFIVSSNWDYRLIFLILCIPFLISLPKSNTKFLILLSIIIASNQAILNNVIGTLGGVIITLISKMI
ncbi:MAG: hypothetical protein RLY15_1475, partial [Bacteroidota bacterium]